FAVARAALTTRSGTARPFGRDKPRAAVEEKPEAMSLYAAWCEGASRWPRGGNSERTAPYKTDARS
ncbi:MAG: hypothetical protein ACRD22_11350, partial [Terriglobia bacterium]